MGGVVVGLFTLYIAVDISRRIIISRGIIIISSSITAIIYWAAASPAPPSPAAAADADGPAAAAAAPVLSIERDSMARVLCERRGMRGSM